MKRSEKGEKNNHLLLEKITTNSILPPNANLLIRCHLQTQLSSGLITAIRPSKLLLVQSYTLSLLFFILRNSSQLSHPSYSNCSKDCKLFGENACYLGISIWLIKRIPNAAGRIFLMDFKRTLTREHTKHARRPRKSFGIVSNDIFSWFCWASGSERKWLLTENNTQRINVCDIAEELVDVCLIYYVLRMSSKSEVAFAFLGAVRKVDFLTFSKYSLNMIGL